MFKIPLVTSSTFVPVENFWEAVLVYHNWPHVVNRKVATTTLLLFCEISTSKPERLNELYARETLLYELRKLKDDSEIGIDFISRISEKFDKELIATESNLKAFNTRQSGIFISIRAIYGRYKGEKSTEIAIFDKEKNTATFRIVQEQHQRQLAPDYPYQLELTSDNNLRILVSSFEDADTFSAAWLVDKLFPKLLKWARRKENNQIKSLSLIEADQYCLLYNKLKEKYGEDLVKNWPQKTSTDPAKYVFEDLGIAAYLICLWKTFKCSQEEINFVDCGCGNGLLVYILNQEGYNGYGVDIRSRKVWDLFNGKANLKVETVTPTSLFPESNWIIGNHSDELTPWIPVMALKSSPNTNYFVLPCCPFDFNGYKYIRTNSLISQYSDYLKFIEKVSKMGGFATYLDKLRIPSTKRTCLVGIRQNTDNLEEIDKFVKLRIYTQVVIRNPIEKVRNCTQLDKKLITRIVNIVVKQLLSENNFTAMNSKNEPWNQGTTCNLASLCQDLSTFDLQALKKECGGLQTLLKNHSYIFHVEKGKVSLRQPRKLDETTAKYRDKPCWFHKNHPNGCLFTEETCASTH